jgi:uncharacterized protein YecT (DUF1311 family)
MLWYDQPVADRIKAMRFYADMNRECAASWRKQDPSLNTTYQIERHKAEAEQLEALAREMETTGKVIA